MTTLSTTTTRDTMRKKLVAGNWKMHGSHSANAELLSGILAARPFACDVAVCVPFPVPERGRGGAGGQRCPLGRAGLLAARQGRVHGRGLGRDAGRVRLPLRDRRPLRAPRDARRDRPARGRQGQGRPRARAHAHRVRGRDAGPARAGHGAGDRQAPAVGRHPCAGALRRRDGRRLRAGLGDRHGRHRHARAGAGDARADPRPAAARPRRTPTP